MRELVAVDCFDSAVGPLLLGASQEAICLLQFCAPGELSRRLDEARASAAQAATIGGHPLLQALRRQLSEYFAGARREFDVPLHYAGTPFQTQVWSALRQIPYGATWSYLDLARAVGDVRATRAVGAANGLNPIAIVIPCHRVINASGALGGYGGGLWRKQILLDLEQGQGRLAF